MIIERALPSFHSRGADHMKVLSTTPLLAIARGLTMLFMVFTATFALDSINSSRSFPEMLPDFFMNLLPTFVLLVIFLLGLRREWIATVGYFGLALGYSFLAYQHTSWILVIAAPLFILGLLYFIAWMQHRKSLNPHKSGKVIHPKI